MEKLKKILQEIEVNILKLRIKRRLKANKMGFDEHFVHQFNVDECFKLILDKFIKKAYAIHYQGKSQNNIRIANKFDDERRNTINKSARVQLFKDSLNSFENPKDGTKEAVSLLSKFVIDTWRDELSLGDDDTRLFNDNLWIEIKNELDESMLRRQFNLLFRVKKTQDIRKMLKSKAKIISV